MAWPAAPADELLTRAAEATRRAGDLTLHQAVTTDPARPGEPRSFATTGADCTARALYASGKASIALRLPDTDGNTRILAAYPAEQAVVELTLAPDGRILRQTQTAPHHISTRTLVYQDQEAQGA